MRKFIIWLMKLTVSEKESYSSGEKNRQSGLYYTKNNMEIIPLSKYERFPPADEPWYLLFKV